jgi:hypothetical protein
VYKRDGRLVPFEPDKISQALFAATESLGRPDAFLARELTDGILHFLAGEIENPIPTTAQLAEVVTKVVRELGQPLLAQRVADFARERARRPSPKVVGDSARKKAEFICRFSPSDSPAAIVRSCLRTYGLQAVYSRDLIAAHAEGLLTLTGLESPLQLNAALLEPVGNPESTISEAVERAAQTAGLVLAVDGLEHSLAASGSMDTKVTAEQVRELALGLRAARLGAVVNLNCATPPVWADDLAEGPLFAAYRRGVPQERLEAFAGALLETLCLSGATGQGVRIDWHLAEKDLTVAGQGRLLRLARLAQETQALAFVFDRPRQIVSLAEGLDRRHPAVLLAVGVHLPRLLEMPGLHSDPDLFLHKLGSLVRLALSAAAQKRDFLRRRHGDKSPLHRRFLLARARLVVVPVGLESVVRAFAGSGLCAGRSAGDLGRKVVQRLREILRQDGPSYQLDTCLDGTHGFSLEEEPAAMASDAPAGAFLPFTRRPEDPNQIAGLTSWDVTAAPKSQLQAAGPLHGAEAGTAAVLFPADRPLPTEEIADLLRYAGKQTDIVRLRFVRTEVPERQLTAPWECLAEGEHAT